MTALTRDKLRAGWKALERAGEIQRQRDEEWNKLTPEEQAELMRRPLPLL